MLSDKEEEAEWKYLDVNEHWQQMKNIMMETARVTCELSKCLCSKKTRWQNYEVAEEEKVWKLYQLSKVSKQEIQWYEGQHVQSNKVIYLQNPVAQGCLNTGHTSVDIGVSANLELVDKFCCLGDMLRVNGDWRC